MFVVNGAVAIVIKKLDLMCRFAGSVREEKMTNILEYAFFDVPMGPFGVRTSQTSPRKSPSYVHLIDHIKQWMRTKKH